MNFYTLQRLASEIHCGRYRPKIVVVDDGHGISHTMVVDCARKDISNEASSYYSDHRNRSAGFAHIRKGKVG